MPRLAQLEDNDLSPTATEILDGVKSKLGVVPNLYRVLANAPAALAATLKFSEELGKGTFDAKTREAIALTTAGANNCDYCASAHTAISKGLSVDTTEITARLHGHSADPKLDAILTFANAVIESRGFVSDDNLSAARKAGLNDGEIVETVANVVANILTNYVNHVADTDIDFPKVTAKAA